MFKLMDKLHKAFGRKKKIIVKKNTKKGKMVITYK